jgi:hypothetical protein
MFLAETSKQKRPGSLGPPPGRLFYHESESDRIGAARCSGSSYDYAGRWSAKAAAPRSPVAPKYYFSNEPGIARVEHVIRFERLHQVHSPLSITNRIQHRFCHSNLSLFCMNDYQSMTFPLR